MPSPAPGNRAAIEAELTPTLRAALEELRELLDVWDWRQVRSMAAVFQQAAVVSLATRLASEGKTPTAALEAAADRLDIERETVRSRVRRWSEASRVHHAPEVRPASGASLIGNASTTRPDEAAE